MSLRPGAKADDAGTRPPEPKKQAPNSDINRNEHYRDLVEHSRDLLCTHDLQGRLLSINPAPARLLGYSVEELMAIPMRELVAPEFRDRFESYLRHIASAGQAHGRVAILTRTGDTLIWEYNNTLRTEGVHSPVVRGMAHDITEQVRAEMAAQRSAEQVLKKVRESERVIGELRLFRTLVDHSSDAIEVVDPDTMRFLDLNEKAFSGLGYTREELLGMSVFDINPVATPKSVAAVRQQIEEHGFVLLETTHQRKDGSTFPVEISIRKVSLERDYLVSVVRDLSERQESEARLKASERRYHALHHSSPVGVCWVETATGRFLGVNTKFCEITGRSEQELLQSDFQSITHPDDIAVSARKVQSLVEGAREYRLEKRYVRPNGSVRWVSLSVVAMWQEGEKPDWHMAIVQDVTDHRLTEEARAQAEQELRRTVEQLQTVSEELRQAKEKLAEEKLYLEEAMDTELGFGEIIGRSDAMKEVMAKVAKVAPSDATVLLLGETGTGKELVARALHRMSGRKNNSFIKMNCAAIPSGLLESELFGHERGAFTGAVASKLGRLELADKGTLFLDEIGEIPLNLQPKLLRVLQDMEFERLGGTQTLRVDFRLLAATNRELLQSVKAYEFRSDLFYRLNVFPIHIPPLRERRQDIRPLVEHFVRHFAVRMKKSISSVPSKTMEMLVRWEWPGNIRELENFIERSVILTPGSVLQCPDLEKTAQEGEPVEIRQLSLRERERERITQVLRECRGRLGGPEGAAARLGLKRTTLQSKLDQMGIKPSAYRSQLTGSQ